jgi:hypothetical protein
VLRALLGSSYASAERREIDLSVYSVAIDELCLFQGILVLGRVAEGYSWRLHRTTPADAYCIFSISMLECL